LLRKAHFPHFENFQLNLLDPSVHTPAGAMSIDPRLADLATPEHQLVAAQLDRVLAEMDQAARAEAAHAA